MIIEGPSIFGRAFLFAQKCPLKIIALNISVDYVQIAGKARVGSCEVWTVLQAGGGSMFYRFGVVDLCAAWLAIGVCVTFIVLLCWNGYDEYRSRYGKGK